MESNLLLICKALFLLIAAHPILSVLRMTYAFITRSMFKKLYWAIPVSLLAVAFYVWLVSFTIEMPDRKGLLPIRHLCILALLLEEFHFLAFNFRK